MIEYSNCHICKSTDLKEFLITKDYFFSGEEFTLSKCNSCGFVFTNPVPDKEHIGQYYKTEKYLSHNSDGGNLISKLYNFIRDINLGRKYKLVSSFKNTAKVLDIGCGTGEFLGYLKTKNYNVVGVEPDENARKFAEKKNKIEVFPEEQLDKFKSNSFEVISMWHVLEHVYNPEERLKLVYNLLQKDGVFINAIPMIDSPDAIQHGKFWAGIDVPRHLHHFSANTFELLAKNCGFEIIRKQAMKFDSYYVSWLSRQAKGQSLALLRAAFDGLASNIKADSNKNYSSMIFVLKKK